jgi:hypothetical protein
MSAAPRDAMIWVRVDGTRCVALPREWPSDVQAREVARVAHALEALAQHGSTSAEESLAGVALRPIEALRAEGVEVVTVEA